MKSFKKLSLIAQYDDLCRLIDPLIEANREEARDKHLMLENFHKLWHDREAKIAKQFSEKDGELANCKHQLKKSNRQVDELRKAINRLEEEKKAIANASQDFKNQIRQVVESSEGCNRIRLNKILDFDQLSLIQSTEGSDIELDYDKTEEEIVDRSPQNHSRSDSITSTDIENVKQQLNMYEAKKRENLAAPKSATLSIAPSIAPTPVSNHLKPHYFINKKTFVTNKCGPCGKKFGFYEEVAKCENCGVNAHTTCKDNVPLPCIKITAPRTRSRSKKILVSDYVDNANPKVPAIIVHCCNEIERSDKIIEKALYCATESANEIEVLQDKILKSKSGMPNLSNVKVHVLTNVVKRFLQGLDDSLITTSLWSKFSEAVELGDESQTIIHFEFFIRDLPPANRDTLSFLMQHLHAIARHSDKNKMTKRDLAKALALTIVGNSSREPDRRKIQNENKTQLKIMETLFAIGEDFWHQYVQKKTPIKPSSFGSRLLETPTSSAGIRTRTSRLATLPTPKLKSLFSG